MRKQRQLNFITEYATEIVHRIVTRKLLNPQNTSMFSHYDKNHLHKNNLFHYNKEMASTLPSLNFVSTIGQQVILETQTPAMQYAQNSANSNHAATIAFVTNYVQSAMQSSNSSSGSSSNSSSGSSSNPAPLRRLTISSTLDAKRRRTALCPFRRGSRGPIECPPPHAY